MSENVDVWIGETQILHPFINGSKIHLLRTLIALKYIHSDFNTFVLLACN
jgi:hypothetical protein